MDWSAVGEWVESNETLVASGLALVYVLVIVLVGAILVGNPTSNYPIISDAVGLALVAHAYRTGHMAELGSALLLVVAVGVWVVAASPGVPGIDAAALLSTGVPEEALAPLSLALAMAVAYGLTVAEVLPQIGRRLTNRL